MRKFFTCFMPIAAVFCAWSLFSCTSTLEPPPLPPSSSSNDSQGGLDTYQYCVYPDTRQCFEGSYSACPGNGGILRNDCPYRSSSSGYKYCIYSNTKQCFEGSYSACPGNGGQLGNSCPYNSSSSAPAGSSSSQAAQSSSSAVPVYDYCVFDEEEECLPGHMTDCPPGGELSNSCPYISEPEFDYCVFSGDRVCWSGPVTDCPPGGILSNDCPYTYDYCVYHGNSACQSGPVVDCYSGGELSNSCPYPAVTLSCQWPSQPLIAGTPIDAAKQRSYLRCSNTTVAPATGTPTWRGTPKAPIASSTVAAAGSYTGITVTANCGYGATSVTGTCGSLTISSPTLTCTLPTSLIAGTTVSEATQRGYLLCGNTNASPTTGTPTWEPAIISGTKVTATAGSYMVTVTANCGTNASSVTGTCSNVAVSSTSSLSSSSSAPSSSSAALSSSSLSSSSSAPSSSSAALSSSSLSSSSSAPSSSSAALSSSSPYNTVRIGDQVWMAENLNNDVSGSKCYNDDPANCAIYGRLYDWATAMALPSSCNTTSCSSLVGAKHQGICPTGWHIPSDAEWTTLTDYVGGASTAGTKLKASSGWYNYGNGLDAYGFAALPGGYGSSDGFFNNVGGIGHWWSASEGNANDAYNRYMGYLNGGVLWDDNSKSYNLFSVRCLQD